MDVRRPRHLRSRPRASYAAGYTLVEVLIAAALLLVIAVGVMPLFSRSIQSNLIGGRASEMAVFAVQDIEALSQKIVDHSDWKLNGPLGGDCGGERCARLGTEFWQVPRDPAARQVGGDRWVDTETTGWRGSAAPGAYIFPWRRSAEVRKYSYADILPGNLDIGGTTLTPLGHPELFDTPLTTDSGGAATSAHVIELRVSVDLNESEVLDDQNQRMTIGQFRVY